MRVNRVNGEEHVKTKLTVTRVDVLFFTQERTVNSLLVSRIPRLKLRRTHDQVQPTCIFDFYKIESPESYKKTLQLQIINVNEDAVK